MVRHNNMISNGHFHKKWQKHIETRMNQPLKKMKRNRRRIAKAYKLAPRTFELLRPIVRCPSLRYHTKVRVGRGFTKQELKATNLNVHYARRIGIAVEHRRRNKSYEALQRNILRLRNYVAKLIVFPCRKALPMQAEILQVKGLNDIKQNRVVERARIPTEEEKRFGAYVTLRKARTEKKTVSRKLKRKIKTDALEAEKK